MAEKIKVLYFVDRMLRGGIQSLVIDWVSRFDKTKIQVDFLLLDDGKEYELEQTLKDMGCNVYKLTGIWIRKPLDFIKYQNAIKSFFKEHQKDNSNIVHMHSSSKNYMVLKYAKKYGIPVRIAHSHCTDFQTQNVLKKTIGDAFKIPLKKYATDYFACSEIAGKWLFGNKIIEDQKFKIIHNAIDYDKFKFNKEIREKVRRELNFENNDIVIGHVGRFTNQKNHEFLIDVFYEIHKINYNYKMLLIGTGELEDKIKEKVKKLELSEYVIFLGFKNDANRYMNAMDIFAFPSLYEGLGLGLIEAQANGIPCIATEKTIPSEVKINDNFKFIELDIEKWKETILKTNITREDSKKKIQESNYFIEDVVKQLEEYYL